MEELLGETLIAALSWHAFSVLSSILEAGSCDKDHEMLMPVAIHDNAPEVVDGFHCFDADVGPTSELCRRVRKLASNLRDQR